MQVHIESASDDPISNMVFYFKPTESCDIIKVKIDNFDELGVAALGYDATDFHDTFFDQGYTLVAYTVKAGREKSKMGPGEGVLTTLNDDCELPKGKADMEFEFVDTDLIPLP
jgi:hypothetical protein